MSSITKLNQDSILESAKPDNVLMTKVNEIVTALNGVTGGGTPGAGTFTTLTATGDVSLGDAAADKVGFYGHATIAQQTGVAVTAAAIHAALVALGLITA